MTFVEDAWLARSRRIHRVAELFIVCLWLVDAIVLATARLTNIQSELS